MVKGRGKTAALLAAGMGLAAVSGGSALAQAPAKPPKLIVVISVDQFGANLYEQYRGKFTAGLARLSGGIAYPSGYQSHAGTETCPGHSTLLTGDHPNKTGITGNALRDPKDPSKTVYCLADASVTLAFAGDPTPVSPANLMVPTLGEWLKDSSPKSRVVAISSKDRAAITMAGHNPDGVFWMSAGNGFTTYLRAGEKAVDKLKPVAAVNAAIAPTWTTLPKWNYVHPDCTARASKWPMGYDEFDSVLPPTLWGVINDPDVIKQDVMVSPIADDLTLSGARGLIKYYNLGKGPATDLLAVSFSATDYVGHRFGTQGPEMCEQMYRLDASIGKLLSDLDALKTSYLVVLSADHGGSDFTERLAARGYDAKRVEGAATLARVNTALRKRFGLTEDPLVGSLEEANVATVFAAQKSQIAAAAADLIVKEPDVAGSFTQEDLLSTTIPRGKPADELTLKERYAESAYAGRSADVVTALMPGDTSAQPRYRGTIAGHGSPWDYDRRVPILFWWRGAPSENRMLPIETVDIAPTLSAVLGLTPPANLDGRCLPLPGRNQCEAPTP
jgi:predicted AlkP superfamily pyrophosphatase or phosphodiesterase